MASHPVFAFLQAGTKRKDAPSASPMHTDANPTADADANPTTPTTDPELYLRWMQAPDEEQLPTFIFDVATNPPMALAYLFAVLRKVRTEPDANNNLPQLRVIRDRLAARILAQHVGGTVYPSSPAPSMDISVVATFDSDVPPIPSYANPAIPIADIEFDIDYPNTVALNVRMKLHDLTAPKHPVQFLILHFTADDLVVHYQPLRL